MCPSGYTMVLRDLQAYGSNAALAQPVLRLKDHGTGATIFYYAFNVDQKQAWFSWEGHVVIGTGGGVDISSLDIQMDITLSGYLLYGVAPIQIVGSPVP